MYFVSKDVWVFVDKFDKVIIFFTVHTCLNPFPIKFRALPSKPTRPVPQPIDVVFRRFTEP